MIMVRVQSWVFLILFVNFEIIIYSNTVARDDIGTSLMVQWLRIVFPLQGGWGW